MSRNAGVKDLLRDRGYQIITAQQGLQSFKTGLHHDQAQLLVGLDGSKQPILRFMETQSYQLQKLCAYFTAPTAPVSKASLQELEVRDRFGTLSKCDFYQTQEMPLLATGEVDLPQLLQIVGSRQATAEKIAPRNELELKLTSIFGEVLGVEHVGIHDNFFELGGSSLLAMRLFTQIEKTFGKTLPPATLFQAPTVEQLALLLGEEELSTSWESLVEIQKGGSKPPFFCIAAADGSILRYRELAQHLGSEQPVYGLQPQGIDGKQTFHSRIEDMAAHYIEEIRTFQPEGPYFLGGFCGGGIVAFEMAQQLHAQGQKVALLALLDAYIDESSQPIPFNVHHHRSYLSQLGPLEKLNYILPRIKGKILNTIKSRIYLITYKLYRNNGRPLPQVSPNNPLVKESFFNKAVSQYVRQVYPGRVSLFRPDKGIVTWHHDPTFGWGKLAAGGVESHDIPGWHTDFLGEPYVEFLAAKLMACLEEAQANEGHLVTI